MVPVLGGVTIVTIVTFGTTLYICVFYRTLQEFQQTKSYPMVTKVTMVTAPAVPIVPFAVSVLVLRR